MSRKTEITILNFILRFCVAVLATRILNEITGWTLPSVLIGCGVGLFWGIGIPLFKIVGIRTGLREIRVTIGKRTFLNPLFKTVDGRTFRAKLLVHNEGLRPETESILSIVQNDSEEVEIPVYGKVMHFHFG